MPFLEQTQMENDKTPKCKLEDTKKNHKGITFQIQGPVYIVAEITIVPSVWRKFSETEATSGTHSVMCLFTDNMKSTHTCIHTYMYTCSTRMYTHAT